MKTRAVTIQTLRRRLRKVKPAAFPDKSWLVAAAFARVVGVLKNDEFIKTPKRKSK